MRYALAIFLPVLISCTHSQVVLDAKQSNQTFAGVLSIRADEITGGNGQFDIKLSMRNESKEAILFKLEEMHCSRGASVGTLSHTLFYNFNRPNIFAFEPGQAHSYHMVCDHKKDAVGNFVIAIDHVFANPAKGQRTPAGIVASDIRWTYPDTTASP